MHLVHVLRQVRDRHRDPDHLGRQGHQDLGPGRGHQEVRQGRRELPRP
jgi:hypothetical protein